MTSEYFREANPHKKILETYSNSTKVRLGSIARELGIKVKICTLPSNLSGQIERTSDGYKIRIQRGDSRERQRFTLAKAMSHFLLHQSYIDASSDGLALNVLQMAQIPEDLNAEATGLAYAIIIPRRILYSELRKKSSNDNSDEVVDDLAEIFGVTLFDMKIRLMSMGLGYPR